MFSFRVRPRIKQYTNHPVEKVIDCFHDTLDSNEFHLQGTLLKSHVLVRIPDEIHHYWSPELQLEVVENYLKDEPYEERQEETIIRGFIGPKSTVWTLFIFFYIICGLLLLFGIILGSSQAMLDKVTDGYWYAILGGIGLISTFIASQIGQKMGEEQTKMFLTYIEETFSKCECID